MATFYGKVTGQSQTSARRCGSYKSGLRSSAQSYNGSVITSLTYTKDDLLMIEIMLDNGSDCYGSSSLPRFYGTLEDLKECFRDWNERTVVYEQVLNGANK